MAPSAAAGESPKKAGALNNPVALKLPKVFGDLANEPTTRWTIFKVDSRLDWRSVLSAARLKLDKGGKASPLLLKTPEPVSARVVADPWRQFLPLCPLGSQESASLGVAKGRVARVVQLTKADACTSKVEASVDKASEALATADSRKMVGSAFQKKIAEQKRLKSMTRFGVSSLKSALRSVGFDMEAGAAADAGAPEMEDDPDEVILHLKPVPASDVDGGRLPVAFWATGPRPKAAKGAGLEFEYHEVKKGPRGMRLSAKSSVAKAQDWQGVRVRAAKRPGSFVYLLGVQSQDSRRVFIEEADVFQVDLKRKEVAAEEDSKKYWEKKGALIEEMGTAKKQRQSRLMAARAARQVDIAEFGGYSADMAQKAQELKEKASSFEEQDANLKAKLLPPYNAEASSPAMVYREGLNTIAPASMVARDPALYCRELADFLMKGSGEQRRLISEALQQGSTSRAAAWAESGGGGEDATDLGALNNFRSKFLLGVLNDRAHAEMIPHTCADAEALARQLSVLNALVAMVSKGPRFKGGKCLPQAVAELTGVDAEGDCGLGNHWHSEYYEEIVGRKKVRSFNGRKALCALIVWSLHLAPDMKLILNEKQVCGDLRLQAPVLRKALQWVGCDVQEDEATVASQDIDGRSAKVLVARLEGPPVMNRIFYESGGKIGGGSGGPGGDRGAKGKGKKRKTEA